MAALTPVESVAALLRAIEKSNLLSAEVLAKARETAAALTDPKAVSRALIKDGTLTRWQSDQLLHGYHRLIIGKYKLLDQLETSPTGRIYLAEHLQMGRRHALKVIAKRLAKNPEAVARFLKGAQNACGLDHKNISHVYDVSHDRLGHYVVMEYVEGQNLEQFVEERGPLKLPQALDYAWQVADGLAYAHSHGVVHGDLKPANLVRDNNGVIKILEIGQDGAGVRPETDDADEDIETASLAAIIFQAPEMRGDGEAADIACDAYSLGSILSFLLTGRAAKNAATSAANLAAQKMPSPIVDFCRGLMADSPADRPHSMESVRRSIESIASQISEVGRLVRPDESGIASKSKREEKQRGSQAEVHSHVEKATTDGIPIVTIDTEAPPVLLPPPVEFAIQTREHSGKRRTTIRGGGARESNRWSFSDLTNRCSPLVLAGAVGGAAVFALGIVTMVLVMIAANRPQSLTQENIVPAPTAQQLGVELPAQGESRSPVAATAVLEVPAAAAAPGPAKAAPDVVTPTEGIASLPATPTTQPVVTTNLKTETSEGTAADPFAATAKSLEPVNAPVIQTARDPSRALASAINLPPLPEADSSISAPAKPVSLGPCDANGDAPVEISLLGGDTAIRTTRQKFELRPREMSPREWDIQLTGAGEPATIANLSARSGELLFQWTDEARQQPVLARQLMNCAVSIGNAKQTIALRTPQKGQPLVIDIEKPSASVKWSISNLPLAKQVFLEVTSTEGFQSLRQDPKGPTNIGDAVTIGTGPGEKSIPLFFKLNTSSAAAIDVRSQAVVKFETSGELWPYRRKDLTAMQIRYQQELGRVRGELRKAKDSRPRAEAEKEARVAAIARLTNEETAVYTALEQLQFVLDFAGATEGAAKVHFRVYFLAGETKIDLLKTEVDDVGK